jgi:dTMP kinase
MPPEAARERRATATDRMEAEAADFHEAVAVGFRAVAAMNPGHWVVVDASGSEDEVADAVWAEVEGRVMP